MLSERDLQSIETLKWMAWAFAIFACACAHGGQRFGEFAFLVMSVIAGLIAKLNERQIA